MKDFDNTRVVLFEKHEVYQYKIKVYGVDRYGKEETGVCLEECGVWKQELGVRIGSNACRNCVHNKMYDSDKRYIICRKLSQALNEEDII